jgi:hypothetical protein
MKTKLISIAVAAACAISAGAAQATTERDSLEVLRQTTLNLIEGLVEQGVFSREKADAMIKAAENKAAVTTKAEAQAAPGRVRVQYVPEHVKSEIREQIKQEVLAQAKNERWAAPNAIPSWLDTIKWEGDLRLRYQVDDFSSGNSSAFDYADAAGTIYGPDSWLENDMTRAAEFAAVKKNGSVYVPSGNTAEKRERFRLRARLGMLAKISENWSGGIRLATGSSTDRVSTNQTLGQEWNKYTLTVDRAYLKYDPVEWLSVSGGRIPNPWFSTDLVWDEDLNFEGVAATFKSLLRDGMIKPFLTVGAFPIKEENPPASSGRWMHGVQAGTQLDFNSNTRLKFGLAWYNFKNFEGQVESPSSVRQVGLDYFPSSSNYGQYEYSRNLRQKGNSLFLTNATLDKNSSTIPYWGLASRFRPINLTASLDLAHFDPVHVILTGDWVWNTVFDRNEIATRTQGRVNLVDGKDNGYQYKLTVGMPKLREARDWQASIAYRYLGSDAVVDAFTDSDFGGGGTNLKGYTIGLQYTVERNAVVGLRWMSADQIDSFAPGSNLKFSLDVLQADVNVRF